MIIFSEQHVPNLATYGILIPAQAERKWQIYNMLQGHPTLGPLQHKWHATWTPKPIDRADLERVHTSEFVEKLVGQNPEELITDAFELIDALGKYNRYDPTLAQKPLFALRDDIFAQCSGTIRTCEVALDSGFSYYLGGGMHHAMPDHGSGFCLVHDIAIAIRKLQYEGRIKTAWVIDIDAHKGDGTAAITKNDNSILTFSIHMARGWPLDGPCFLRNGEANPSFTNSTIDIGIEEHESHTYNLQLHNGLQKLKEISPFKPDLVVVVDGSDPYEGDILPSSGLLKLSLAEMLVRNKIVYEFLKQQKIPQAYVLAGGYGPEVWRVHAQFVEFALTDRLS